MTAKSAGERLTAKQREALQQLVDALELPATRWGASSTTVNRLKAFGYVKSRKEKTPIVDGETWFSVSTVYEPTDAGRAALREET